MHHRLRRQAIWAVALTSLLVAVLTARSSFGSPIATSALANAPASLPPFGIGLAAQPDSTGIYGWMPDSGVPWSYAYQYLAAGVNTGSGWETWNPDGQFPLLYAKGANSHGYIPVFPYYMLLQSNGSCGGCGEAQKDLSNLNNVATMSSYYQNFILLMQRLGPGTYNNIAGYGKTAIVHVEPDLSGYAMQAVLDNNSHCYGYCTAQGNNPAYLMAAVQNTGVPQVAAYPNTYQGFNWALLHLRDLYAPNVLLAFHISDWATGFDIGSDSSSTLNATALGQQAGSFAAQSGITGVPAGVSTYDLLFNDVADRDAGYYKYVLNNPRVWWDRLNVTFPNFHRWESYVSAASQAAGRPLIIWQIPEGNQYFATVNNSTGHYQDNRAEYFFAHLGELQQAGIIGLLFGAGNGGSTVHWDGTGDRITNPASICNSDGVSSGTICNNHTSVYADDDGGYIRLQAAAYYTNPTGAPTATPTPARTPGAGLLGDINADGIVDIRDYGIWRQSFGAAGCGNPADLDANCTVDVRDYGIWRQNFGATLGAAPRSSLGAPTTPAVPVSTPASASILVRTPTPTATPIPVRTLTPTATPNRAPRQP